MQAKKVIKSKPVEVARKSHAGPRPVEARALTRAREEVKVPAMRKSRAASCVRCPQRDLYTGRGRRSRSSCTAPKTTTNPDYWRPTTSSMKHATVTPKGRETRQQGAQQGVQQGVQREAQLGVQREAQQEVQRGVRAETRRESHKAFTVIPPNPKKRREIQRKAEAELAALEELRLSRAMAYVSINPSSVGGCLSLEEVRLKQQQEMMHAKRNQKSVRKQVVEQVLEQTAVLKC